MTRVLSIIHYPVYGGPHNRNATVAPLLAEDGVETIVLLPDEPGNAAERLRQEGIDVVALPLSRLRARKNPVYHMRLLKSYWSDISRIRRLIKERKIDVVQVQGLVNMQGAIAARLEGIPVVWQILDTMSPIPLRWVVMPFAKRLAAVVMCTGKKVAEQHPGTEEFGERLVLFHPPVNVHRFSASREKRSQAREALRLKPESLVIGNVSNINPQKGHGTFIRAAAELRKSIPSATFVILGATYPHHEDYAGKLWDLARQLGLEMGVDLIVQDPGRNVEEWEQAFDLFWMTPEPKSEGIPTAMEEAMALGLPVVSTRVGSIEEIVLNGETGYVVEPYDAQSLAERTREILENEQLWSAMSIRAREFSVQNFASEICARRHQLAYEMALSNANP